MSTRFNCPNCPVCGKESFFIIEDPKLAQKIEDWAANPVGYVQDALRELSVDMREQIITGTHKSCWDKLFAGIS